MHELTLNLYPTHCREDAERLAALLQAQADAYKALAASLPTMAEMREMNRLEDAGGTAVSTAQAPDQEAPPAPPKPAAKKKGKKKASAKKDEPAKPEFADVRAAVGALMQAKGRDVVTNFLKGFDAEKVSGIPEEKWPEAIEQAQELVGG